MKYFTVFLLIIMLCSCKSEPKKEIITDNDASRNKLTTIKGYPDGFVGCGCAFSLNKEDFDKEEFVYFDKYGMTDPSLNFEMISLNNETIKWLKTDAPKGFSVKIEYKSIELSDPYKNYKEGTLTITFKDDSTIKKDLYGTCGC